MATAQEIQAAAVQRHIDEVRYRARCKADFYCRLQEALHSSSFLYGGHVYRRMVILERDIRTITTPSLIIKLDTSPTELGSLTVTAR